MPLSDIAQVRPGGGVPAYFSGLLPEGRRLGALRREIKTSADDELSLLLGVGGDVVGNVQVLPEGAKPGEIPPRIEVSDRVDLWLPLISELPFPIAKTAKFVRVVNYRRKGLKK